MTHTISPVHSEQEIIDQFLMGDKKVFDQLYDRYAPALFGIICHITGSPVHAEQILRQSLSFSGKTDHTMIFDRNVYSPG